MGQPGTSRNELKVGMQVVINPQNDRTRKLLISGAIKSILTNSPQHSHGILVCLESGEIGRVREIVGLPLTDQVAISPEVDSRFLVPEPDLQSIIAGGENHFTEFKSSILWSIRFSEQQIKESTSAEVKRYRRDASKFIIAKTIAGFLNSDGGNIVLGIKENKSFQKDEIIGVESEFFKLEDQCVDGYRRMILDQIVKIYFSVSILHHFNDYMQINFEEISGKIICWLRVKKSDEQVFINFNKDQYFFVRIDASTRELHGADIVSYCMKRFI